MKINFWVNEYLLELNHQNETNRKLAHLKIPTTKMCSEYFKIGHNDILVLLNNFERYGLIEKRRRQSEGLTGVGFDGALHSEIKITEKGREMCVKIVTI